jgi:hypothetical protein
MPAVPGNIGLSAIVIVGLPATPEPSVTVMVFVVPVIVLDAHVSMPVATRSPVVLNVDKFCSPVSRVNVNVPAVIIGEPPTVSPVDPVAATEVTVPLPPVAEIVIDPAPFVIEIFVPAVRVDSV